MKKVIFATAILTFILMACSKDDNKLYSPAKIPIDTDPLEILHDTVNGYIYLIEKKVLFHYGIIEIIKSNKQYLLIQ